MNYTYKQLKEKYGVVYTVEYISEPMLYEKLKVSYDLEYYQAYDAVEEALDWLKSEAKERTLEKTRWYEKQRRDWYSTQPWYIKFYLHFFKQWKDKDQIFKEELDKSEQECKVLCKKIENCKVNYLDDDTIISVNYPDFKEGDKLYVTAFINNHFTKGVHELTLTNVTYQLKKGELKFIGNADKCQRVYEREDGTLRVDWTGVKVFLEKEEAVKAMKEFLENERDKILEELDKL